MTLHEISTQLHHMTNGHINGEHFSRQALESNLHRWMRSCETNAIQNSYILEVELADGKWLCEVHKFAESSDGYDYYIPDTREQEARIWEMLSRK